MGSQGRESTQDGFSLVELTIAMTVTLIVSGAIFQLMTAGQSAFRREPAMADRQQNIRMGMDIISQDLYRAGAGFPQFAQVFTDNLDGVGPLGSGGAPTDELEVFLTTDCGFLQVCDVTGTSMTTFEELSACYDLPALVILANAEEWYPYWAEKPGGGASASCVSGGGGSSRNGHVTFPPGQSTFNNPGGPNAQFNNPPEWMLVGQMIRYRINLEADGTPNLERSTFGGNNFPDGSSSWEVIARGVEDLQVEYLNGTGWLDEPGTITCGLSCGAPTAAEYDTLIRRVRVRLSARALEANLKGQTTSAVGDASRGQLVTEIAPRAGVTTLGQGAGDI